MSRESEQVRIHFNVKPKSPLDTPLKSHVIQTVMVSSHLEPKESLVCGCVEGAWHTKFIAMGLGRPGPELDNNIHTRISDAAGALALPLLGCLVMSSLMLANLILNF